MGIELNGLFFPNIRPLPLDFFFKLPFLLGFPKYQLRVVVDMDNPHHVRMVVEHKHFMYY